jgi:hypothetical protein
MSGFGIIAKGGEFVLFQKTSYAPEKFRTLTARQKEIYNFLVQCVRLRGQTPTVREIAAHFQIRSPNGVICHLSALERKGFISKMPMAARGLQILIWPGSGPNVVNKDGKVIFLAGADEHIFLPQDALDLADQLRRHSICACSSSTCSDGPQET